MGLVELNALCRRRGFRLVLDLVDPTGRPVRSEESYGAASLQVRVVDRDGQTLAGRVQSDPGREPVEQLAELVLGTLHRKGLVA